MTIEKIINVGTAESAMLKVYYDISSEIRTLLHKRFFDYTKHSFLDDVFCRDMIALDFEYVDEHNELQPMETYYDDDAFKKLKNLIRDVLKYVDISVSINENNKLYTISSDNTFKGQNIENIYVKLYMLSEIPVGTSEHDYFDYESEIIYTFDLEDIIKRYLKAIINKI